MAILTLMSDIFVLFSLSLSFNICVGMSCFFPLFCLYRRYVPFIFAADFPYRTQTGNLPRFYFITFLRFPLNYSWNKHNDDSSGRFWVVIRPCYARWFILKKKKTVLYMAWLVADLFIVLHGGCDLDSLERFSTFSRSYSDSSTILLYSAL